MNQQPSNNQLARVIAVMCDKRERTVSRIVNEIWNRYGVGESASAITECLNEVARYGWARQQRIEQIGNKPVLHYQLVPIEAAS